jgi:hypothetical protein
MTECPHCGAPLKPYDRKPHVSACEVLSTFGALGDVLEPVVAPVEAEAPPDPNPSAWKGWPRRS